MAVPLSVRVDRSRGALLAALVGEGGSVREVVTGAVHPGGNADTNASIAAGIAGAHHGLRGIPAGWARGLRGREIVHPIISALTSE